MKLILKDGTEFEVNTLSYRYVPASSNANAYNANTFVFNMYTEINVVEQIERLEAAMTADNISQCTLVLTEKNDKAYNLSFNGLQQINMTIGANEYIEIHLN